MIFAVSRCARAARAAKTESAHANDFRFEFSFSLRPISLYSVSIRVENGVTAFSVVLCMPKHRLRCYFVILWNNRVWLSSQI